MTPDIVYDQMIGMGLAKKVIFSYASRQPRRGPPLRHRMRDAIENGYPRGIETVEQSHSAMGQASEAGASGLPLAIFRGYMGADLPKVNPDIRSVTCPFTGEQLAAIPAHRPDVTFIHAQKASRQGDVLIEGIIGVQKEAALAAKRVVVTVEEVVPDFKGLHPNLCILPHWTIDAIAVVPGGAHPSYTQGYYARDNAAYLDWDRISADRELFAGWMDNVANVSGRGSRNLAARVEALR